MVRPVAAVIVGTRPEAIKLAPVVEELRAAETLTPVVIATSQHRELLRQSLRPFDIVPDFDLDIMAPEQTPSDVAREVLSALPPVLEQLRPAWTIVQGDTTTAFSAAVASFHAGVPVAHVEAGLRTGRMDAPFPEEFNRRAVSLVSSMHFAPTQHAAENLVREGFDSDRVLVTGNTVVDAVQRIVARETLADAVDGPPLVVLTLHRRESFGTPMRRVLGAVRDLVLGASGGLRLVYPVHPNPEVEVPVREMLSGLPGVELPGPMDYPEFLALLSRARFAMTDSGGVQEEGPALGVPVLVLRKVTERPELVNAGWGRLVGTAEDQVLAQARRLLESDEELEAMKQGPAPFGDGRAAERIAAALGAGLPGATGLESDGESYR